MATKAEYEVKCPKCNYVQIAECVNYIDGLSNPRAKQQLLAGKVNIFECKKCRRQSQVGNPFLYFDTSKVIYVKYIPFADFEKREYADLYDEYGRLDIDKDSLPLEFRELAEELRLVFTMQELIFYIKFRELAYAMHGRRPGGRRLN